jgi:GT2 family glycosyltransferase
MEHRPRFSIVIPFHRSRRGHDILFRVVESCLAQSGSSFEIRLVTNLPDPRLERALLSQNDPRIFLDCAGKRGVNSARNLGADRSRGEFLLFLDDDCALPHANYLEGLAELFSRHSTYAALGGPYHSKEPSSWRVRGYNAMASAWAAAGADPYREVSPAVNLLGGNLCVKREVFKKFQFDETILSGGDETELLRRLSVAGKALGFAPSLEVLHLADGSWKGLLGRAWRQGRARRGSKIVKARRVGPSFLRALKGEPSLLPFSLVHFPALYLAEKAPKFPQAVKKVGHEE